MKCRKVRSSQQVCYAHSAVKVEQYAASLTASTHPALKRRLLRMIGSFPGRHSGLQGRSVKKHRCYGSRSMGVSYLSVDFWWGDVSLLPTYPSFLTGTQNESARKRLFFSSPSLQRVCVCVCLRGQTGVIPPLADIPSLSPSRRCVQPYY